MPLPTEYTEYTEGGPKEGGDRNPDESSGSC